MVRFLLSRKSKFYTLFLAALLSISFMLQSGGLLVAHAADSVEVPITWQYNTTVDRTTLTFTYAAGSIYMASNKIDVDPDSGTYYFTCPTTTGYIDMYFLDSSGKNLGYTTLKQSGSAASNIRIVFPDNAASVFFRINTGVSDTGLQTVYGESITITLEQAENDSTEESSAFSAEGSFQVSNGDVFYLDENLSQRGYVDRDAPLGNFTIDLKEYELESNDVVELLLFPEVVVTDAPDLGDTILNIFCNYIDLYCSGEHFVYSIKASDDDPSGCLIIYMSGQDYYQFSANANLTYSWYAVDTLVGSMWADYDLYVDWYASLADSDEKEAYLKSIADNQNTTNNLITNTNNKLDDVVSNQQEEIDLLTNIKNRVSLFYDDTITWLSDIWQNISNGVDDINSRLEDLYTQEQELIDNGNQQHSEQMTQSSEQHDELINGYDNSTITDSKDIFSEESDNLDEIENNLSNDSNQYINDYTSTGFDTGVLATISSSMLFVTTWFTNFWNMGGIWTAGLNLCFAISIAFFILKIGR